ncbi:butyrophilin-like protein 2 isoform X2 [Salmo salar]|uniref:Butyrophilin-like protein 2 isoform X2 n=1 Tax=Salmo salar TaxID=8030 RepID=A0ABM3E9J1_SALSA|nr:butyrophilin-like protein 2 isoform X2 [Salmo salar]
MERTCPLLLLLSTLVYCSLGQSGAGIYDEDSFGSSGVQVVGPADQVVALAGDDIILPCSLKPSVNAEDMVVEWTRSNLRKENVHLYSDGRDSNVEQVPSYSGRTSMFNEELKNGNVSLKLTRVTLSDAGSYMCFIPTLTSQVKETTVQLFVGAVSQPVISIDGTKDWGVVLRCESGGWFPEPEMEWLDSSGTILPADGPPERHRDSEGLYTVRRHVTVNQTDTNRFTCRVQQQEINHMKETEIHVPGSSEVQVVGPADPVVALAGDDIILPCSLKPNVNAENMVVRWTRLNLKSEVVHRYSDGRDSNVDQSPSYRNRTSVFNEELKNGNVSLKLTRVTLSDAGSYRCFIPTLTSQVKETTVQLFVGAVSQPVISIDGTKDWGVVLKCESGGWFPEPEMEWLDSSGTILPADGPPERHRDSEGLYTVRRHVTVNQTDTNRFTCRVQQQEINHMKETEIHVPDIYDDDIGSSEVQVVGPADPVVALAGDDIILPCSLKPSVNAEDMVVEWTRLNPKAEVVHLYRDGRDSNKDQSPSYRGRTSMFHEELKNGNVSLKLTRVTLSDAGSYKCFIKTLTSQVNETTIQLLVGAVSQPVTSIIGTKGGGVVLKCESGGWFPEPEMEWLDSSGTILPADGPPERHRDSEGLYTVRRHVTVNQTDTNRFTCRVQQQEINHMKETEIHVPGEVFIG